jgi:hypothetical protein
LLLAYAGLRALGRSARGVPTISRRAVALGFSLALAGVAVIGWLWASGIFELVSSVLDRAIITKLASESGERRLGGDAHALWLMIETGGLGVGWGGNKASSQLLRVASTTGLMGLVILGYFVIGLIRRNRAVASLGKKNAQLTSLITAHGWAVTGMFLAALIAAGDPNALGFWIGLAMYVAVLAGAADQEETADAGLVPAAPERWESQSRVAE